jgi:hypothetical protein
MKIQFRTYSTLEHVACIFGFSCIVYAMSCFNTYFLRFFGEAEKSVLYSRGLNVTHFSPLLYCELPYDDCLCTVLFNKSDNSEKCITYVQLIGSRILPLVSFFLQIYLVRKLFSLNSDHPRVIIYTLSILSIFTFIGMTISIYWNSCYHVSITYTQLLTGTLLWLLSLYNLVSIAERTPASSNGNKIVAARTSGKTNKPERAWQELP